MSERRTRAGKTTSGEGKEGEPCVCPFGCGRMVPWPGWHCNFPDCGPTRARLRLSALPSEARPVPNAYECMRCDIIFVAPNPEPFCEHCRATLASKKGKP